MSSLNEYNKKRNFKVTKEPKGKVTKALGKTFVVQHHLSKKDHYDFRLEYNGVLISFAVPKGPSYNPNNKRLAIKVENHPLSYRSFEGNIPKGEYGAGTVMLWDNGKYKMIEPFSKTLKKGYLKFKLLGKKLKGTWALINLEENNWILIKENDNYANYADINDLDVSVKSGKNMDEIKNNENIKLTSGDKVLYKYSKVTKKDVMNYYKKVSRYMLPYVKNRALSVVRAPEGVDKEVFYKKHFSENNYLRKKNNLYYISDEKGILNEVQMNSIEFHTGRSTVNYLMHPDIMVFDLDPDEHLAIDKLREGVMDLKHILDNLNLKSFLKTSGGKGYHIFVPFKENITAKKFEQISINIAKLLEKMYPEKYTTNMNKEKRKGKIFIDYLRNKKNATSIAPYSLRARKEATVSMPIKWSELYKIKPDDIKMADALKRLRRKDPWTGFFE